MPATNNHPIIDSFAVSTKPDNKVIRDGKTPNTIVVKGANFASGCKSNLADDVGDTMTIQLTNPGTIFPSAQVTVTFLCGNDGKGPKMPNLGSCDGNQAAIDLERAVDGVRGDLHTLEMKMSHPAGRPILLASRTAAATLANPVLTVTIINDPDGTPCAAFCSLSVPVV